MSRLQQLLRPDPVARQQGPFFGAVIAQAELMGRAAEAGARLPAQVFGAAAESTWRLIAARSHHQKLELAIASHTSDPAGDTNHWAALVPAAKVRPPQLRGCCNGAKLRLVITTVAG
jgi:hypothetical protein